MYFINTLNFNIPFNLDSDATSYVTIILYNDNVQMLGCSETSCTATLGWEPYKDVFTGEIVDLNPIIRIEDSYEICLNEESLEHFYTGAGRVRDQAFAKSKMRQTFKSARNKEKYNPLELQEL